MSRFPVHEDGIALGSAARTATVSSSPIYPNGHRGIRFFINVTADPAAASLTPTVETWNRASDEWITLLTGAAVAAVTTAPTPLTVYPGATAAANSVVSLPIGQKCRITMTAADADSITYSVGYELLP